MSVFETHSTYHSHPDEQTREDRFDVEIKKQKYNIERCEIALMKVYMRKYAVKAVEFVHAMKQSNGVS